MSASGSFTVSVPHICGRHIPVEVAWIRWPGNYWNPPDGDEDWSYEDRCEKCGVLLIEDWMFQDSIMMHLDARPELYDEKTTWSEES